MAALARRCSQRVRKSFENVSVGHYHSFLTPHYTPPYPFMPSTAFRSTADVADSTASLSDARLPRAVLTEIGWLS